MVIPLYDSNYSLRREPSLLAVLASRSRRSLARVETPVSGENRGETAVFAGYSLNPTTVLSLNETPLGDKLNRVQFNLWSSRRPCSQAKTELNFFPFFFVRSPPSLNIHMEILQTNLQLYITKKKSLREFGTTFSFVNILIFLGEI